MNAIGCTIIICVGIAVFVYKKVKQFPKYSIESAFKRRDYSKVLEVINGTKANKFLSIYELDVYRLKAYFLVGDKDHFVEHVKYMAITTYKNTEKEQLFETWFHRFLLNQDKTFAEVFLQAIKEGNNSFLIKRCELAFEVMMNHNTSVLDVLKQNINEVSKDPSSVGIYHFLCGIIYELENDVEKALHSFDIAMLCFESESRAIYMKYCQDYININGDKDMPRLYQVEQKKENEVDYLERYSINYMNSSKNKKH